MSIPNHIELRVEKIISTPIRKKLFEVVLELQGEFTVPEVYKILKAKKIKIETITVLNVVKSLYYAGFLSEQVEIKDKKATGRRKNIYKRI